MKDTKDDIEITSVQDGALTYVSHDGIIEPGRVAFGNDIVSVAPDGGLLIEKMDGSGCGQVAPGDVAEYLRAVQASVMKNLPASGMEVCDGIDDNCEEALVSEGCPGSVGVCIRNEDSTCSD